jgi:2-polyprenyl-3-methyl-5-hydroxy-6-metoxy-1,4-benzoquinol methylase
MLEQYGHSVDLYDKFYARNDFVFDKQYDFITASEVAEHLNQPMVELNRLMGLLKSNGVLAIMTQILTPQIDFNKWYYKNDPSHIGFFSEKALNFLSKKWQAELCVISERVVIFKKNKTLFG